ncbi:transcription antitermination factor NusB [Gammaproteobacteria bacterium]|nr:transcription antitermination factor NusB [Gammaproteobacteria bacterium]
MNKRSRTLSRKFAIEILYQMSMRPVDIEEILERYASKKRVDHDFLSDLIQGVAAHEKELSDLINNALTGRFVHELDVVESSILKIGAYQLKYRYDIPYKVVIDESVSLVKVFGGEDSYRLINSVLDGIAKKVRKLECGDQNTE